MPCLQRKLEKIYTAKSRKTWGRLSPSNLYITLGYELIDHDSAVGPQKSQYYLLDYCCSRLGLKYFPGDCFSDEVSGICQAIR